MKAVILLIVLNMPSGKPHVQTYSVHSVAECKADIEYVKGRVVEFNIKGYSVRSAECLER